MMTAAPTASRAGSPPLSRSTLPGDESENVSDGESENSSSAEHQGVEQSEAEEQSECEEEPDYIRPLPSMSTFVATSALRELLFLAFEPGKFSLPVPSVATTMSTRVPI